MNRRTRHRIPLLLSPETVEISERYQAEINVSTQRLERRYRNAQKSLEAAERRAERARHCAALHIHDRKAQRRRDELLAVVDERRRELREIELLMMPAHYNGRDSRRRGARHETGTGGIALGGYKESEFQ